MLHTPQLLLQMRENIFKRFLCFENAATHDSAERSGCGVSLHVFIHVCSERVFICVESIWVNLILVNKDQTHEHSSCFTELCAKLNSEFPRISMYYFQ